jgi:hypothetical protein
MVGLSCQKVTPRNFSSLHKAGVLAAREEEVWE